MGTISEVSVASVVTFPLGILSFLDPFSRHQNFLPPTFSWPAPSLSAVLVQCPVPWKPHYTPETMHGRCHRMVRWTTPANAPFHQRMSYHPGNTAVSKKSRITESKFTKISSNVFKRNSSYLLRNKYSLKLYFIIPQFFYPLGIRNPGQ